MRMFSVTEEASIHHEPGDGEKSSSLLFLN